MFDTLPPILSVWSGLAAPLCCSENKLQARLCSERLQSALEETLSLRLTGLGSTIYPTVWKPHTTPLGRQISRLRVSARRISDSEPSLVPSGWPTPRANDMTGDKIPPGRQGGLALKQGVQLSGWPTPTSRDHKDGKECPNVPLNALLGRVVWLSANPQAARITADGMMLTGCSAGMESGGQLNPAFSAWLMGFPEAWCRAAISCQLPTRLRKAPKKPGA